MEPSTISLNYHLEYALCLENSESSLACPILPFYRGVKNSTSIPFTKHFFLPVHCVYLKNPHLHKPGDA